MPEDKSFWSKHVNWKRLAAISLRIFLWHKRWKMFEDVRMLLLKMDGWRKIIEDDCLKTTIQYISLYIEDTVII